MINIGFLGVTSFFNSQPYINNAPGDNCCYFLYPAGNADTMSGNTLPENVHIVTDLESFAKAVDYVIADTAETADLFHQISFCVKQSCHIMLLQGSLLQIHEARHLISLAAEADTRLHVASKHLLDDVFVSALPAVRGSMFAEVINRYFGVAEADLSNHLFQCLIDDISLLMSTSGSPVRRFTASGANVYHRQIDMIEVRLEFQNGRSATIIVAPALEKEIHEIKMYQFGNIYSIDLCAKSILSYSSGELNAGDPMQVHYTTEQLHNAFYKEFITGSSGLKGVPAADETWYESLKLVRGILERVRRYY